MGLNTRLIHIIASAIRPLLLMAALFATNAMAADPDWKIFKQGFIEPDGRVIDNGHGKISHSEGQGFAMLLAVHHDDRSTFDRLWQWTRQRLQVRGDRLFAWRWEPQAGVTDMNNASDADLLIAWALLRAAERWHDDRYLAASQEIARDIRSKLLRQVSHGLVLLPGAEGFDKPEGMTVNLSYWVWPALADIGRADPAPEWKALANSGLTILQYARFGRWGLPPDWLRLAQKVVPAEGFPERFGFDAVRIPLYLLWSRHDTAQLMQPYREYWAHFAGNGWMPAWTNLNDDSVDSRGASAGIRAIAQWTSTYASGQVITLPALDERQPYYSAALLLLCKMAINERAAR
jgi:endoglucanase